MVSERGMLFEGSEMVRALLARLGSQDRALANARSAATELSRRRLEREEVELFLADRRERATRTA
jgi:hypothetical protein